MEKRIVYTREDGGMSVVIPVGLTTEFIEFAETTAIKNIEERKLVLSEAEVASQVQQIVEEMKKAWLQKIIETDIPESATNIKIVDVSSIPSDRTFRGAWEKGDAVEPVKVNMPKARTIHMGRIRVSRDKRLNELDKRKYGNEHDAERQTLRKIPQEFDLSSANNPDELKALWPVELG